MIQTQIASGKAFGWLAFLAEPLYWALRFLHGHGAGNWGWTIILFTVIFNCVTLWPRVLAVKSSLRRTRTQPKVDAVKKRYAHLAISDPKRAEMQAEMMAVYKAEGVSLYGGCLPMLLQMPLLFAYFRVLQNASELHHAGWLWLTDLSLPDPLHVLPLLIVGCMMVTQWMTPMPGVDSRQRKMMAVIVPLGMGLVLWRYAAGLALYWLTGNLFSLVFQWLVNRSEVGREMRALAVSSGGV